VTRRSRRCLVAAVLAALPVWGLAACGDDEPEGGSITIAETARPDFLDPALSYTLNGWEPMWLVYTPLLTYRHAEGEAGSELIPGLARELPEISADGRTYKLRLRDGIEFSDGKPVRASDFEHTIKRVLNLESPGSSFFLGIVGANEYAERNGPEGDISGIETDDAGGTVTIRLLQPDALFSDALASIFAGVVPSTAAFENLSKDPPPGVGAYVIARNTPNREFVLRRNRNFEIEGIPSGKVDRITVRIITSLDRQAQDVIRGRLDYMQDPPPPDMLRTIRREHSDRFREFVTAGTSYFFLNSETPPFDQLAVRQAVNHALDQSALRRIHGGLLASTCNFLPPSIPGHAPLDPCPYGEPVGEPDLERARELVREAGATGKEVKVWSAKQDPGPQIAAYYADALEAIGLKSSVQLLDFAVYPQIVGNRKTGAQTGFMSWTGEFPHPYSYLRQFESSAITDEHNVNIGNVRDPYLDRRIEELSAGPAAEAQDDWAELDRRVIERAHVAVWGHPIRTTFMSERMDFDGCSIVHPVYGNDYSSFCLK
jgi:peptide/nickel transport system substrate-binding protein